MNYNFIYLLQNSNLYFYDIYYSPISDSLFSATIFLTSFPISFVTSFSVSLYFLDTVFKLNMDSSYEVVSMKDGVTSYSNEDILKMIAYLYGVQQSKE